MGFVLMGAGLVSVLMDDDMNVATGPALSCKQEKSLTLLKSLRKSIPALIRHYKYILILLIVSALEIALNFGRLYSDSGYYVSMALGHDVAITVKLRFMTPYIARLMLPVADPATTIAVVNSILWIASVLVCYLIGRHAIDDAGGFQLGLLFTTSVSMIAYGAAVLTDISAYFFAGLGMLLMLLNVRDGWKQFVVGLVMATGVFFHPSVLFVLPGVILASLLRNRKIPVLMIAGVSVVFSGALLLAYAQGWSQGIPHAFGYVSTSHLLRPRPGEDLLAVLAWTFGIAAPFQEVFSRILGSTMVGIVVFLSVMAIGLRYIHERKAALLFLLPMLPYLLAVPEYIERYLFVMWPVVLPWLVVGVRQLALIPVAVVRKITRNKVSLKLLYDPNLYATVYIVLQGLVNNYVMMEVLRTIVR
jgi:hypothetical protein